MGETDREYYTARAQVERARGDRSVDPMVAKVHHRLADMYEALVRKNERASLSKLHIVA